ncbi:MAG: metal ABC transporter permease [bacterium]
MIEFFYALAHHGFMLNAVLTGLLASVACGVVGTYVVTRRITYLVGGIAHSVLGGMGLAYYLAHVHGMTGLHPTHGAVAAALLAAVAMTLVNRRAHEREDTVIGTLWAVGMAVGIIFIAATPGYNQDLMSYLFGNILLVTTGDLWLIVGLDLLVLAVGLLFYRQLVAVSFDEEFAQVRGIRVGLFYLLLLTITALTVVILVTVVGIVMVIALLTIPAAVAGHFCRTMRRTMLLATGLCAAFTTVGLGLSYSYNLPPGATVIILASITYLASALIRRLLHPYQS